MKTHRLMEEKTFILIKPDGVKRALVGECIKRFEQRGLKIVALKMVAATREQAHKHYPGTNEWLRIIGEKTLGTYKKYGKDAVNILGTKDPIKIGKIIHGWLTDFFVSGPVMIMVVSGIHAIDMVRKIVGETFPAFSPMGTIRGDFSVDSPVLANEDKRAIHNLIHASGDASEAEHEIKHWFTKKEIHEYKRAEEDIMF